MHRRAIAVALCLCTAACVSIGPATIPRDRFDYGAEIGDSWKQQTLVNLVPLRYLDMPVFVDIGQIVGGYTLESGVTAATTIPGGDADTWSFNANGRFTDRPTITYSPITGNAFLQSMMTPVSPEALLFTIQSNWPADLVLGLTVGSINGLRNQAGLGTEAVRAHPDFVRVVRFLRSMQAAGAFEMRVRQAKDGERSTVLFMRTQNMSPELLMEANEVKKLLGLDPERQEYRMSYGAVSSSSDEIAIQTRSMLHVMLEVSAMVEVPESDVVDQRAARSLITMEGGEANMIPLRIRVSADRPARAFVSVPYRDHWFFIADNDLRSKAVFTFLMLLFTLSDTSERQALPLITIPTG